jgi:nucleoside-diphosphate-sugar epimerase
MNILVTGGAGYIGSILVPDLLSAGHNVTVIDNFMYRQVSLLDCCNIDNLEIINGDVRDHGLVQSKLVNADFIIPLACLVGAPLCDKKPLEARSINYDAIKDIISSKSSDQRIIFPTTNSGYGIGEKGKYCTEETPLNPISLYGKMKVDIEKYLLAENNTITLRLATVFGISPRMRLDLLVNDFVYRAVYDRSIVLYQAHFIRNYIHVRDVADAFIHCIDHFDLMKGEAYNVGLSDANLSKYQLCEKIKEQLPELYFTEAEIGEDPDKRDYLVSNEKIEKTNYKPKRTIAYGIAELIKGYQIINKSQFGNI